MEPLVHGLQGFEELFGDLPLEAFRHVLIVDDDPQVREQLKAPLRDAGYEVEWAASGREALEAVRYYPPSFLITDWDHDPPSGPELCRLVRAEKLPHYVYIMLLSSRRRTRDVVQGLAAGADTYLTKPVPPGELIARLAAGSRMLELERRLSEQASRDPLTGLLNRRNFFDIFRKEWLRSERYDYPLSCVMIDIDHFKQINDTWGHLAGDDAIKAVARHIDKSCRASDWVCRFGGEEFCVLLPESNIRGAAQWAERCRKGMETIVLAPDRPSITASFGAAQKLAGIESPERLLDAADQALLAAKRAGRNRVLAHQDIA